MFHHLDETLRNLLDAVTPGAVDVRFGSADINFETPEKGLLSKLGDTAINLFLYEVKENRALREALPATRALTAQTVRRRPPMRIDCTYMVTAWSKKSGADKVAEEHSLLGAALNWLSRFPVIPERFVAPNPPPLSPTLPGQIFAPPTMVAQMDGAKGAGEFWHALGIAPRPYFNLIVTICMDLDRQVDDPLVTTISSNYLDILTAAAEERLIIGGTVLDPDGKAAPDAWVRLEPLGRTHVTDAAGRFVFENVPRSSGLTLRARARSFGEGERTGLEIPSPSGEYDIRLK